MRAVWGKPAERIDAPNLTCCSFQANSGSAGRSRLTPWPRRVWDRHICPVPTVPQSSLSFSVQKQKCLSDVQPWGGSHCGLWAARPSRSRPVVDTCKGTNDVSHSHNMMQDWFDWSGLTWKSQGLLLTIIALIKDLTLFSSSEFKKTLKI